MTTLTREIHRALKGGGDPNALFSLATEFLEVTAGPEGDPILRASGRTLAFAACDFAVMQDDESLQYLRLCARFFTMLSRALPKTSS